MPLTTAQIQNAYVAFFNRPADVAGLQYWSTYAGSTGDLLNTFAQSNEYKALYANMNSTQIVNAVYQNLFGRAPEVSGLNYWVGQLDNGKLAIGNIADAINKGSQGTDATIISNKVTAATAFTNGLDTTAKIVAYAGVNSTGLTAVKNWLAAVTSDAATLTSATSTTGLGTIISTVQSNVASTGSTFTLTTAIDTLTGTAGSDTFQGLEANFGALDKIDGGDGNDNLVLALTSATNTISGNQVSNVETLTISQSTNASTGTGVVVGATGVTKVANSGSTVGLIVSGLGAVGTVDVSSTTQNTTIIYADTAVTGTADTATVALNNVTGAAQVNLNSATANTVGIETVALASNGSVANSITLTTNDTAGLAKVTVSGAAALTLALGTNVTTTATTVDGSAATGALTISGFGAAAHTVTGGTGADRFQFAGNLGTTDTINGGDGVDTLSANGAQLAGFTTSSKPTVTGLETIELADDVANTATAIDVSLFGTINNVRVSDQGAAGAAAITFNNIAAVASGSNNIRIDGDIGGSGGTLAFNIANATNAGTANAVTLDLRGGATTATSTFSMAGVETLTVDTTNATGAQTFNLTDPALTSLTLKGGQNVVMSGAALGTVVATVDASGLTGTATAAVTLNNTAVNGATVTGSANADTFVGTQLADTITGGNGGDTITGAGGIDTIVLTETTAATDTVKISAAAAAGVDRDIVTGFNAGATNGDVFNFNSGVATLTGTNNFAAASSLQTHNVAGALTTAGTAEVIAVTTATIADVTSTNSLNGTNLLTAIGGTITGAVAGQNDLLFAVGIAGGGTAIYYASSADNAIIASEITLVGVLNGVSVGSLVVGNFANAA